MNVQIRAIHQIEITSRCNLRCKYCTHPKMPRVKQDIDEATYTRALRVASMLAADYPRIATELNLAGIGESTMHPDFVRFVWLARERMPASVQLILATNGLLMTQDLADAIAPTGIKVWVSLHRPERAGAAVEVLKRAGILAGVSADPSIASVDWAGQVDWHVSAQRGAPCPWVPNGRVFVMSDGRVSVCCFDAKGDDVLGHIDDPNIMHMRTRPYELCKGCHMSLYGEGVPNG